jgi:hypothetical protein
MVYPRIVSTDLDGLTGNMNLAMRASGIAGKRITPVARKRTAFTEEMGIQAK